MAASPSPYSSPLHADPRLPDKSGGELWCSILFRRVIRRGVFPSVKALVQAVMDFIEAYDRQGQPFPGIYTPEQLKRSYTSVTKQERRQPLLSKTSIALLIRRPQGLDQLLAVQRPDDPSEEFPGLWGLPAATCRPGESLEAAAHRAAREKLGLSLDTLTPVASGAHQRPQGLLAMTLFEATCHARAPTLPTPRPGGATYYTGWRWAPRTILEEGVSQGSLCCALALGLRPEGIRHG